MLKPAHYYIATLFWLLFSTSASTVNAAEAVIIPPSPQGWTDANVRDDSTVAITTSQARPGAISGLGDGSIEFRTTFVTAGQDKADYQFIWQTSLASIDFPARTLASLSQLSFDYYRNSSSTVGVNLHPALRLFWFNDNNTPINPTDDTNGIFIFEAIYQPGFTSPIATDLWVSNNISAAEFWMFCVDCDPTAAVTSGVVQNFNLTFANWLSGPQTGAGGDPTPPDLSFGNTYIVGINTGIGSGWGADVLMHVDNIQFAFGAGDDQLFNFEVNPISGGANAIPVLGLSGLIILILGLFSLAAFRHQSV